MSRFFGAALALAIITGSGPARADDKDVDAVLDKAIQALGGREKLEKARAGSWKAKGTISFGGNDNEFSSQGTYQGLDHYRSEFTGNFGGNEVKGVTVLNGDKGWRKFGDMEVMELDGDALGNEKRTVYLVVVPMTILPLKDKGFKVASASEEKVDGKPAAVLKITGPDGKDFTLYLDKDTGLPVKQVAKVMGFGGEEFTQETTYADYKDMAGIKKATKVVSKRDGEPFIEQTYSEFKPLDQVEASAFAEPK